MPAVQANSHVQGGKSQNSGGAGDEGRGSCFHRLHWLGLPGGDISTRPFAVIPGSGPRVVSVVVKGGDTDESRDIGAVLGDREELSLALLSFESSSGSLLFGTEINSSIFLK